MSMRLSEYSEKPGDDDDICLARKPYTNLYKPAKKRDLQLGNDPDKWIAATENNQCQYLPEPDMLLLCDKVVELLIVESNVVSVSCPVTICGDIHGQYYDLEELFRIAGLPPDTNFIFMGDFVDRGHFSLETLTRLLTLKVRYPKAMILLRGNHESRQITQVYGFYDECVTKYGNATIWNRCCQIFDLLPLAALIDQEVFCVHGGLSPEVKTLDSIWTITRNVEIPQKGALCDLMWSDPEDGIESWQISPRGAGWVFGQTVAERFLQLNGLSLVARAHQLVQEGYKFQWDDTMVTVWSAPNYCYRCGNVASVLEFGENTKDRRPKIFNEVAFESRKVPPRSTTPYFL